MGKEKKDRDNGRIDIVKMALLEDELRAAKLQNGETEQLSWWKRKVDQYLDWKENRPRHLVRKKTYLLLTVFLGWMGGHRFYEKRWKLGLFYLLLCWTGFPLTLTVVDFMIAAVMPSDGDGRILI